MLHQRSNMSFFDWLKSSTNLEIENEKLQAEVKNLKQVIDELFAREHESKAVYHAMSLDFENRIKELQAKNSELQDSLDDLKVPFKKKHFTKINKDIEES